jgi:hypothetical protein
MDYSTIEERTWTKNKRGYGILVEERSRATGGGEIMDNWQRRAQGLQSNRGHGLQNKRGHGRGEEIDLLQIVIVLDRASRVRIAVLMNAYLDLENPGVSGFWVGGYMSQVREMGKLV